jgi:hypothetical protein
MQLVTSTKRPNVLCVSFLIESSLKNQIEIVCLVEAADSGKLQVWYRHHITRERPTGIGAWSPDFILRHHILSPAIRAVIRTHVMVELFSHFLTDGDIAIEEQLYGPLTPLPDPPDAPFRGGGKH